MKPTDIISIFGLSMLAWTAGAQTTSGTTTPIKHVVVIFQENASFDHYFGTYPKAANLDGEPIFVAKQGRRPTPSVNGLSGPLLTHNPNSVQPFRLGPGAADSMRPGT